MRKSWDNQSHHKEMGMAKICVEVKKRMDKKAKNLVPLKVGDYVQIQNQSGPKPTCWDKSGTVVEAHGHRQYSVRVDGSGHVTLRNRKFLKCISPTVIKDNVIGNGGGRGRDCYGNPYILGVTNIPGTGDTTATGQKEIS